MSKNSGYTPLEKIHKKSSKDTESLISESDSYYEDDIDTQSVYSEKDFKVKKANNPNRLLYTVVVFLLSILLIFLTNTHFYLESNIKQYINPILGLSVSLIYYMTTYII
jgi:hypothetical protein